jgi:hypothetical protein
MCYVNHSGAKAETTDPMKPTLGDYWSMPGHGIPRWSMEGVESKGDAPLCGWTRALIGVPVDEEDARETTAPFGNDPVGPCRPHLRLHPHPPFVVSSPASIQRVGQGADGRQLFFMVPDLPLF